jgi:sugar phosphate isomerase/epimerase
MNKPILKIKSALLLFAALLMSATLHAQSGVASVRKGASQVKISLNAFSFNDALLNKPGSKSMSIFELIDWSSAHGFDAVDITGYYFPGYPIVPGDEFINSVKRYAFLQGIDISGTGIRNDFTNPDPAKRATDVKLIKQWIDVAAKLGAPVIRIFSGPVVPGYENKWDEVATYMAASIKECTDYAQQRGVLIGLQNHGDFIKTADDAIKIIKLVNSDWCGLIVDSGNFTYAEIAKAMPYAVNFQLKESFTTLTGEENSDLVKIMTMVKQSGYKGYLPVETLGIPIGPKEEQKAKRAQSPYSPYTAIPAFLKEVKAARQEVFN